MTHETPTLFERAEEARIADPGALAIQRILVAALPVAGDVKPEQGLVESIRAIGVLSPIILSTTIPHQILDGKRRAAAAARVLQPTDTVPVMYAPEGADIAALITLTTNWHRSDNVAAEADAVAHLVRLGWTTDEIAAEFKVTKQKIKRRLALVALPEPLWTALREGKLAPSVAVEASQLPPKVQQVVSEYYAAGNKLTTDKLREFRQAVKSETAATLPDDLFADGGVTVQQERTVTLTLTETQAATLADLLGAVCAERPRGPDFNTVVIEVLRQLGERLDAAREVAA